MSEATKYIRDVLLHFTTLKSAALILNDYALKPGSFARSNDVYENIQRLHAQPFFIEQLPDQNYRGHSAKKSELIESASNIRFLSFCKAKAYLDSDGATLYVQNDKLAFRKMWGQYADKFGGACLIFDRERLVQVGNEWPSYLGNSVAEFAGFDVTYQKQDVSIRTLTRLENLLGFDQLRDYFSKKHSDWEDEQEFRFLFRSSSIYPTLSVCDSLIGVVLGEKNNPNVRDDIYDENELGFVNLLIGKMQTDLRRDFTNFSDLDIYHFPDASPCPLQFKELKRK